MKCARGGCIICNRRVHGQGICAISWITIECGQYICLGITTRIDQKKQWMKSGNQRDPRHYGSTYIQWHGQYPFTTGSARLVCAKVERVVCHPRSVVEESFFLEYTICYNLFFSLPLSLIHNFLLLWNVFYLNKASLLHAIHGTIILFLCTTYRHFSLSCITICSIFPFPLPAHSPLVSFWAIVLQTLLGLFAGFLPI